METSLYIHIPFCRQKCLYCDFYSAAVPPPPDYIERLKDDIAGEIARRGVKTLASVYIGGGTPSILPEKDLRTLLDFLEGKLKGGRLPVPYSPEFTCEANSESISREFIRAIAPSPVTRLSIGVQTLNDRSRRICRRLGTAKQILKNLEYIAELQALRAACGKAPVEISFDLMSGLPFQTQSSLESDIETLSRYSPVHFSLYDLTLAAKNPLLPLLSSEDERSALWISGRDKLQDAAFIQYEVSNFAKAGHESVHNVRYWQMKNYLGCGEGACGTIFDDEAGTARRYTLFNGKRECEFIDRQTLLKETFMMGLRYFGGIDRELFQKRFSAMPEDIIPQTIKKWTDKGLYDTKRRSLTQEGLLFLNAFLRDVFYECPR